MEQSSKPVTRSSRSDAKKSESRHSQGKLQSCISLSITNPDGVADVNGGDKSKKGIGERRSDKVRAQIKFDYLVTQL